ncbi:MAG: nucleoid-associated protein [Bacillota bacterium]|nr:nucleoid-associated protein [Bacillota bacterium]
MSINVKKAVIHVLNKEANEPLLNGYELEITEDLSIFLEKHITKSISDDEARKGRFKEGMNIIQTTSSRMIHEEDYFLEGSKDIARQLFKAMKTNSSISSTDLIVCTYDNEDEVYVAILKMDYTTSYIHEIEMDQDDFKISIKKQEISLPGPGQKIQKCAFVRDNYSREDFDLIILDNQINNKNDEEPIAQFFLNTFLSAELMMDSRTYTKLFKKETENWIREKAKEGDDHVEDIRELVINTIRQEDEIDLTTFSQNAFGAKQYLHEDFKAAMQEKGLDVEKFEVDKEWVEKKLCKVKLKIDNGIEVVVDYDIFNDKERFEILKNPDGTRSIIIKNISSIFEK